MKNLISENQSCSCIFSTNRQALGAFRCFQTPKHCFEPILCANRSYAVVERSLCQPYLNAALVMAKALSFFVLRVGRYWALRDCRQLVISAMLWGKEVPQSVPVVSFRIFIN